MSTRPPAMPDFIPDDEMPDFISDADMEALPTEQSASIGRGARGRVVPASAASRFMAPIREAISGGAAGLTELARQALRQPNPAEPETMLNLIPGGLATAKVAQGMVQSTAGHAREAVDAAGRGDIGEAAAHGTVAMFPSTEGQIDILRSASEGDLAGAAGQLAVQAAPMARVPARLTPTAISAMLRNRAARRIIDVQRPARKAVTAAEDIADDLVSGVPRVEESLAPGFPAVEHTGGGGIGVGSLETLAERAKARAAAAGEQIEALQSNAKPVAVDRVSKALREEAARMETVPPPREVLSEVPIGLLDDAGEPIMGIKSEMVKGVPASGFPSKVAALRAEADAIDNLAAQYPDAKAPAGELFKYRSATGQRIAKAYGTAPGEQAAAGMEAGKSTREQLTKLLHEEVPASVIPDREYRVFRTAWKNFETHRQASLTNRGLKGLKDLLAGRAGAAAIGGLTGTVTAGPLVGVAGALGGVVLGESAYWGSLRASTYAKLASALNNGQLDVAADILQKSAAAYAINKAGEDRARNRKAQRALETQAQGVVP